RHHGLDNIRGLVLERVESPAGLDAREIFWVRKLRTKTSENQGGLNSTAGGTGLRPDKTSRVPKGGELSPNARITWEAVGAIRQGYSQGQRIEDLAEEQGISYSH